MNVWFFAVLVIGIVYVLNRLTSMSDLPVSTRLAEARALLERNRGIDRAPASAPGPAAPTRASAAPRVQRLEPAPHLPRRQATPRPACRPVSPGRRVTRP
jgi:hypothetical protein